MRRVLLPARISDGLPPAGCVLRAFHGRSMGTTWSAKLADGGARAHLQGGLQGRLDAVVAEMSHWLPESDLGRFNRAPAGTWHALPAAFFEVLAFALQVARDSGGAYDPCAGALVNLWGFGPDRRHAEPGFAPPTDDAVAAALAHRRGARVELDPDTRRARQPGGALLDLSSVAKGYAVDRLALYLEAQGIGHYLVEVGGELRGAGLKPDGQPWWVVPEVPDGTVTASAPDADGGTAGELVLALHGLSVATSGDYRRYFSQDGRNYSHTIDPRSGAPIRNALASVTVVHAHCMAADAWSTALTVLGAEAGMALAERHGLAARFLVRGPAGLTESLSSQLRHLLDE